MNIQKNAFHFAASTDNKNVAHGWQTLTRPGRWQLKTRDPAVPAAQTLARQLRDQLPPDAELRLKADLTLPVDEAQLIAP